MWCVVIRGEIADTPVRLLPIYVDEASAWIAADRYERENKLQTGGAVVMRAADYPARLK
jgi:hypothetical protein